ERVRRVPARDLGRSHLVGNRHHDGGYDRMGFSRNGWCAPCAALLGIPISHWCHARGNRRAAAKVPVKNRLRVLRAERNWSQADLADRLEISRQSVNAIE